MAIDAATVRKVAKLARLSEADERLEPLARELNGIMTWIEQLAEVDVEGAPLGIKDLFCTEGFRTTAASKILGDFKPTYESTVTSQLWRDGAVMLGKLNLDEFAMGSSNETSAFGPVSNPWRAQGSNQVLTP